MLVPCLLMLALVLLLVLLLVLVLVLVLVPVASYHPRRQGMPLTIRARLFRPIISLLWWMLGMFGAVNPQQ